MGDLAEVRKTIEQALRGSGVAWKQVGSILDFVKSQYSEFSVDLSVDDEEKFLRTFKRVLYFAIFAHAPQSPEQVANKHEAWLWIKDYVGKFVNATKDAKCDMRTVVSGMAEAFDRALIAMGRIKYPLHWPPTLCGEFVTIWSTLSDHRMALNGWNLEPSQGDSPSRRYWSKVKAVSEAMKANKYASEERVAEGSPEDGPSEGLVTHGVFGHWISSGEDSPTPQPVGAGMQARSPVRLGINSGPGSAPSFSPTTVEGGSAADEVKSALALEERIATQNPLLGWPESEVNWAVTTGRLYHADGVFSMDLKTIPKRQARSASDIVTSALLQIGATRVPSSEFWTLDKDGQPWDVLQGRDFVVWKIPDRAVCEYRHEYRMGVRLGPTASGKFSQHPLITLENTPPGIRLSSAWETIPFLSSYQQVGTPPAAYTDAQLGNAVYTYQAGEVAFQCGATGSILWRIIGKHSRAHQAEGGNPTKVSQKGKVGFCPCCSMVSHIAAPATYLLGDYCHHKAVVMGLWQYYGPWGPRRYTALQYVKENDYLPKNWDWAASTLNVEFPELPYLASASEGGICDYLSNRLPPLNRSVPDMSGFPEVHLVPAGGLSTFTNMPLVTPSRDDASAVPPRASSSGAAPKPPPPVHSHHGSGVETGEEESGWESEWGRGWSWGSWRGSRK